MAGWTIEVSPIHAHDPAWHPPAAGTRNSPSRTLALPSRYSALALARYALSPDLPWPRAWRAPPPKASYDVVIIGRGGHGLATAYCLAANHGITNVAVLERAYIGSGNVGRNSTLVRSNTGRRSLPSGAPPRKARVYSLPARFDR
jgi:hypothetical protein